MKFREMRKSQEELGGKNSTWKDLEEERSMTPVSYSWGLEGMFRFVLYICVSLPMSGIVLYTQK